ncbi:MAG: hypothetical protein KDD36_00260 [Flavobacteriales bacterium]|nr:hypothetical protein [Flavobacteriales bacterium]
MRKFKLMLLILAGLCGVVNAQERSNSPYSRYGIGELYGNTFSYATSLAGASIAFRPNVELNLQNPASLTAMTSRAQFGIGIFSHINKLKVASSSVPSLRNTTQLSQMSMGFRIKSNWKGALSLAPYSGVGYSMVEKVNIDQVGEVKYKFNGYGGVNKFTMTHAYQWKNLSVGVNASYIFGRIDRQRSDSLPDNIFGFNSAASSQLLVRNFVFETGAQYHRNLYYQNNKGNRDSLELILGATYGPPGHLNKTREDFLITMTTPGGTTVDTSFSESFEGKMVLPLSWGAGASIGKTAGDKQWRIGVDYTAQPWSNYTLFDKADSIGNAHRLSIGGLYQNDAEGIQWRGGLFLSQTYHELKGIAIQENGIAFGLSVPMKVAKPLGSNYLNLGFVIGERGTTDQSLIKEQFIRLNVGFSFQTATWFLKRKYD